MNKMTAKAFVVSYLLSTFKYLILGCSEYQLSGPLIEKLKIAVNYNSNSKLEVSGVPVRRRLPQVCFVSQTKSVETQTELITNATIERFTKILNGEKAARFSRLIDIILKANNCMEFDSNYLFVEIYHRGAIQVLNIVFLLLICI